jgi:hypothetical protein
VPARPRRAHLRRRRRRIYGADAIPAGYAGARGLAVRAALERGAGDRRARPAVPRALGPAAAGITTTAPFASPQTRAVADAQRILTGGPGFGVVREAVGHHHRRGLGDMELAAKYSLFNTFGHDDPNARLTPTGSTFRSALTACSASAPGLARSPRNFLDVPTGTGANAVGVRSTSDLLVGRRFWTSLGLRYTAQLPDDQLVRITDAPERVLAAQYRQQTVRRNLGDFFELEATPRFVLTNWLAVAGQYYYRNKGSDRYTGRFTIPAAVTGFTDLTLDANTLNQETSRASTASAAGSRSRACRRSRPGASRCRPSSPTRCSRRSTATAAACRG